jgi:hypothetical protein
LIVLTAGPRNPAKHQIWNEALLYVSIHLRMDDKALAASTAVHAWKPKHLCKWYNNEYDPNTIKKFLKCRFTYAVNIGLCYSTHDFKDGKGNLIVFIPPITVQNIYSPVAILLFFFLFSIDGGFQAHLRV